MATAERQGPRTNRWLVRNKDGGIEASGRTEVEARVLAADLSKKEAQHDALAELNKLSWAATAYGMTKLFDDRD